MTKRKEAEILRLIRDGKPLPDSIDESDILWLGKPNPERSALIDWQADPFSITDEGYDFLNEMEEQEEIHRLTIESNRLARESLELASASNKLAEASNAIAHEGLLAERKSLQNDELIIKLSVASLALAAISIGISLLK